MPVPTLDGIGGRQMRKEVGCANMWNHLDMAGVQAGIPVQLPGNAGTWQM